MLGGGGLQFGNMGVLHNIAFGSSVRVSANLFCHPTLKASEGIHFMPRSAKYAGGI